MLIAQRLQLSAQRERVTRSIVQVHSELSDTISPVIYGVTSLNRLLGKRMTRQINREMRELFNKNIGILSVLIELQSTLVGLDVDNDKTQANIIRVVRHLDVIAEDLFQTQDRIAIDKLIESPAGSERQQAAEKVVAQLVPLIRAMQDELAQEYGEAELGIQGSIAHFVETMVLDMKSAMDIKAEGNLIFALLATVAEVEGMEALLGIEERFKRSRALFKAAAISFGGGALAKRNPILADNVESIEQQLSAFGDGQGSLFRVQAGMLKLSQEIEEVQLENRLISERLTEEIHFLVKGIQTETSELQSQVNKSRTTNEWAIVVMSAGGLFTSVLISLFTVSVVRRHEAKLRLSATILQSSNEGVLVTNTEGKIVSANPAFSRITGYSEADAVGQSPHLLNSGLQSKGFFDLMWRQLRETDHWQGEIVNRRKNGEIYPEWLTITSVRDDSGRITHYAGVFSDISTIKKSQEKLDFLAHHDPLTSLPNRLLLGDRLVHALQRAERDRQQVAVLFIGLDRFKTINDTMGHAMGDEILKEVGTRLQQQVRAEDTVARLGGVEFMILLEQLHHQEDASRVSEKILKAIELPIMAGDRHYTVTASVGVSIYPDDGVTGDELIRNADTAMYSAKEQGKNKYQFYSAEFTAKAMRQLSIESDLRRALERNEFELYYQPQCSLKDGSIVGMEALIRWNHPERGMQSPAVFLGAAEESGLMVALDRWVFAAACRQCREWIDAGITSVRMSVNISGGQINQGHLVEMISDVLKETGCDPNYLEVEITEGFLIQNPDRAIEMLESLREMGIALAVDDFGTGYSSLSYLKRLPIQKLKIDRSFVRDIPDDPNDEAISRAIIALGHSMQLEVLAEGVETEAQQAFLVREQCDCVQGYLYSKPVPAADLVRLLKGGVLGV